MTRVRTMQGIVKTELPPEILELLSTANSGKPPESADPRRMRPRRARMDESEVGVSPVAQERILGTHDLVDVAYLQQALNAARSVGRVVLRDHTGREIGYGTGFKVAPNLLLTNRHVLENDTIAATSLIEFDYELDEGGSPRPTTRFALDPRRLYISDRRLDFALVAIAPEPISGPGQLQSYGFLRMMQEEGTLNPGEFVTIIHHPSGLPKQIAIRKNKLLSVEDDVLWYQSDTAQGTSGSPVFDDSWQIVALHHSGVPRTDKRGRWLLKNGEPADPRDEDGDIDWLANEGIRAIQIVRFVRNSGERSSHPGEFVRASTRGSVRGISAATTTAPPLTDITAQPRDAVEPYKRVWIDTDYDNRKGYDPNFLGIEVPLPEVIDESLVAKMDDGQHVLPYQNFTVVMDKSRRLALFAASNVDARFDKQEPEPSKNYSPKGLGGLKRGQREVWSSDPRIPQPHQLPDRFFAKDGSAFDKGHLARRDSVAWGDTYDEVRRANGDSFHTTNCTPQVSDFNRGDLYGLWGKLEDVVLDQADTEKLCVFSGPLLQEDDRIFVGKDDQGEVRIQIPSVYWKIIVARQEDEIQSFGFLLEQDLSNVPLEFAVEAPWLDSMVPTSELEGLIGNIRFPEVMIRGDQYEKLAGEKVLSSSVVLPGIGRESRILGARR